MISGVGGRWIQISRIAKPTQVRFATGGSLFAKATKFAWLASMQNL